MKSMKCSQLGGACDKVFQADTFEEIAKLSKAHGIEMFKIKDAAHMEAMGKIQNLMSSSESMQKWVMERKAEFDALPNE